MICKRFVIGMVFFILLHPVPSAATKMRSSLEIEAGAAYEDLSGGYDSWRERYLAVLKDFGNKKSLRLQARDTKRFSLNDKEVLAGGAFPLSKKISASLEAGWSSTHRVLPEKNCSARIDGTLGEGWLVGVGYAFKSYDTAYVDMATMGIENYFSNYRMAYTLFASKLEKDEVRFSHGFRFDGYYGDESMIAVGAASGEESEKITGKGVVTSTVQSAYMTGRHWFKKNWALTWNASWQSQGDNYDRYGLRTGLRYRY